MNPFTENPQGASLYASLIITSLHDPCDCHKNYMAFEYLLVGYHQRTRDWKLLLGSQTMSTTVTLIFHDCHVITSNNLPLSLGATKKVQDKVKKAESFAFKAMGTLISSHLSVLNYFRDTSVSIM